jgi:hypothetical protein
VPSDRRFDRNHAFPRQFRDLRPVSPVDQPAWKMKNQIDDPSGPVVGLRPHEFGKKLADLRAHALEPARRREQGIEDSRPHRR